jgi:hypothetical protein
MGFNSLQKVFQVIHTTKIPGYVTAKQQTIESKQCFLILLAVIHDFLLYQSGLNDHG